MDFKENNRESEMINFIDEVDKERRVQKAEDSMKQSTDYKLRMIKREKEKAKGICLDAIFSKVYKDALPFDNEYKISHGKDLDTEITDFLNSRNHEGMEYYIKEAIKNGSVPAKKIMESVEKLVKDCYFEKEMNIKDTKLEDIPFDVNSPENVERLAKITDDMELEEISEVIKDNIRKTTQDEIQKVKEEDDNLQALENELAENPEMTSEAAINKELTRRGYKNKKFYTPSLFSGIMINKLNLINESMSDIDHQRCNKLAFVESVKEYAKWSIVKAFKLEDMNPSKVDSIAVKYAKVK